MKKILVLMFFFGLVITASAQHARVIIGEPGIRIGIGAGQGYGYHDFEFQRRIDQINMEYDNRIWSVEHDPYLSRRQKRRAVRELNFERDERIRDLRRWY